MTEKRIQVPMLSPAQNREIGARYVPTPSNLFKCAFCVHLGAILVAVMPFCAMGKHPGAV